MAIMAATQSLVALHHLEVVEVAKTKLMVWQEVQEVGAAALAAF